MTEEDIISFLHDEYIAACHLYPLKFSFPKVTFFTKTGCAGRAWYTENLLEFNSVLALENGEAFKVTITHELAHLITKNIFPNAKQAHGPEFKSVMRDMGSDTATYHKYDTTSVSTKRVKTRYIYSCACDIIHELTIHKHKNKGYCCTACKARLLYTGNMRKFK